MTSHPASFDITLYLQKYQTFNEQTSVKEELWGSDRLSSGASLYSLLFVFDGDSEAFLQQRQLADEIRYGVRKCFLSKQHQEHDIASCQLDIGIIPSLCSAKAVSLALFPSQRTQKGVCSLV